VGLNVGAKPYFLGYKKFFEFIGFMGEFKGTLPSAEKWVFIRRSLIFRVGGEDIIK
jgi:hypothetical protein